MYMFNSELANCGEWKNYWEKILDSCVKLRRKIGRKYRFPWLLAELQKVQFQEKTAKKVSQNCSTEAEPFTSSIRNLNHRNFWKRPKICFFPMSFWLKRQKILRLAFLEFGLENSLKHLNELISRIYESLLQVLSKLTKLFFTTSKDSALLKNTEKLISWEQHQKVIFSVIGNFIIFVKGTKIVSFVCRTLSTFAWQFSRRWLNRHPTCLLPPALCTRVELFWELD